jgi:uncharacterized heparinase superfamily protein
LSARLRRAARKPPKYLAARAAERLQRSLRRPWSAVFPRLLSDRALLGEAGSASIDELWGRIAERPFFVTPRDRQAWTSTFRTEYLRDAEAIIAAADRALAHEFDLLGSGPVALGPRLPWHQDFKTGRTWNVDYACDIEYAELDRPTDVKVPWELSRCQHFTMLGQAYWLTGDERYAREIVVEIVDWTESNPWAYGVNWICAMDVALRAVSWIWAFAFIAESAACADRDVRSLLLRSLYLHGEFIATHLETSDVNGNHYLCDGVGLVFLGTLFPTPRAGRWLAAGRDIVVGEIDRQVSSDGVDFEKSTAYQRLVLECFLTSYLLLDRHGDRVPADAWARVERMLEYVAAYTKPNGQAPLIGDADDGRVQKLGPSPINDHRYLLAIGAERFERADFKHSAGRFWPDAFWLRGPEALERFAALPAHADDASRAFPEGGVFVLRGASAHMVVDCGEVGMNGRGGHGHNDILSFELWLGGANLITDCGAYLYTASREWRNLFRSTAFHNTLQIDAEELNRFIAPDALWQLRDDARPAGVRWHFGGPVDHLIAAHTGYHRLASPVRVERVYGVARDRAVVAIADTADGDGSHRLTWRFHLDPAVTPRRVGPNAFALEHSAGAAQFVVVDPPPGATVAVEDGWVSPSYGVKQPTRVIVIDAATTLPAQTAFLIATDSVAPLEQAALVATICDKSF